jgi:hypothetical protein
MADMCAHRARSASKLDDRTNQHTKQPTTVCVVSSADLKQALEFETLVYLSEIRARDQILQRHARARRKSQPPRARRENAVFQLRNVQAPGALSCQRGQYSRPSCSHENLQNTQNTNQRFSRANARTMSLPSTVRRGTLARFFHPNRSR